MDRNHWMDVFSSAVWEQQFETFLTDGGNVNETSDDEGSGLIHYAIDAENYGAINWLIANGADVNAVDGMGWSALHYAVDSDIDMAVQANLPVEFRAARFMLSTGVDALLKDKSGFTARDIAAEYGATVLDQYDKMIN